MAHVPLLLLPPVPRACAKLVPARPVPHLPLSR